jgi:hypothetical protein
LQYSDYEGITAESDSAITQIGAYAESISNNLTDFSGVSLSVVVPPPYVYSSSTRIGFWQSGFQIYDDFPKPVHWEFGNMLDMDNFNNVVLSENTTVGFFSDITRFVLQAQDAEMTCAERIFSDGAEFENLRLRVRSMDEVTSPIFYSGTGDDGCSISVTSEVKLGSVEGSGIFNIGSYSGSVRISNFTATGSSELSLGTISSDENDGLFVDAWDVALADTLSLAGVSVVVPPMSVTGKTVSLGCSTEQDIIDFVDGLTGTGGTLFELSGGPLDVDWSDPALLTASKATLKTLFTSVYVNGEEI